MVADPGVYERAEADWQGFWAEQAGALDWFRPWDTVLEWDLPFARWFDGGTLNVSYNCLDRHVAAGRGDKVAFHWEGEPGDTRTITYAQLLADVCRFANVLQGLGVGRGDRVAIYMPMIPELPVAMLACTRIGAAHSVVFGGFSSDALRDRIIDAEAKVVITADGGWRRGAAVALKANVDAAVSRVAVRRPRGGGPPDRRRRRRRQAAHDRRARPLVARADERRGPGGRRRPSDECEPEHMDAEDLLFILYTSGTTAAPKGIMHTTGGYLTQVAFTHRAVFDLHPDTRRLLVRGRHRLGDRPQLHRLRAAGQRGHLGDVRGHPRLPRQGPVVVDHRALRGDHPLLRPHRHPHLHEVGDRVPRRATTCRPCGCSARWASPSTPRPGCGTRTTIGGGRCPVVDTWWQTETGAIMIAPLPGITTTKPGSATFPLPGIAAEVVDEAGTRVRRGGGYLTLTRPWPSMLRGIYGDPERYRETYWSRFAGRYFAGDGAKLDDDGYLWLLGRVDDVMNVSGHRISTTEVESALVDHPAVAEAAVVGADDPTTGQAIVAFVTLRADAGPPDDERGQELRAHVADKIGPIARPKTVIFTDELPKTRSGKIMRRLLRDVAEGRVLGDTTTLADPGGGRGDPAAGGDRADRRVSPAGGPTNWAWHGRPARAPGEAVVFDVDGVLSDAVGRQHFIERGRRDWDAFFDACGDDPLIGEVVRVLELLDPRLQIDPAHRPAHAGPAPDPGLAGPLRAALGPAGHAVPG